MTTIHVLLALYALYMLARHGPRALRAARSREHRAGALIPIVNVVLAFAILVVAVKAIAERLISP